MPIEAIFLGARLFVGAVLLIAVVGKLRDIDSSLCLRRPFVQNRRAQTGTPAGMDGRTHGNRGVGAARGSRLGCHRVGLAVLLIGAFTAAVVACWREATA